MLKAEKEKIVAELTERLRSTDTLIVADYRGLTMTEIDDLRTKLLEHGARFSVVKNTLTRRAAEAAGSDLLLALLEGPTAIAFIESDGDPVAVAKALADTARTTKVLAIRGGILDGKPLSESEVTSLATLPSADVIRAQVLGAITSPLQAIVGLFTAPLQNLHGLIDARIEQLGGDGGQAEETEAAAAQAEKEPEPDVAPAGEEPEAEAEVAEETPTGEEPAAEAEDTDETPVAEVPAEPENQSTEPEASVDQDEEA